MRLSRYVKAFPCPDQPGHSLLYSTKRSALIVIPDVILRSAKDDTIRGINRDTLVRLGFLVPDPDAERLEMRDLFIHANRQRRLFNALVVLNLDCNLACGYCYEDNFRGNFYMSAETAEQLLNVVLSQVAEGKDVRLSFYGGEPLLSLDMIEMMARKVGTAAKEQGTKFTFSLVTNGTLLSREVVLDLVPLGLIGAKITLDGPRETHDVSRPFVSGSGSYDAIIRNVASICGLITLHLGGNFTRDNYKYFPLLLDNLTASGVLPDQVARVMFVPVIRKSGEKATTEFNSNCACGYEPWLVEAAVFLREETLKRGYPVPKIRMSACSVEYESDVVINYNGTIYKCPAFMANDALRIGTLKDGISDYRGSHNLDVWKKEECLDCAYLPLCFGGCRNMELLRHGEIKDVDCRKEYYDAALEALVRQDMKYQGKKG